MFFSVENQRKDRKPLHPGGAGLTACAVVSGPGGERHPPFRRTCPPEAAPSRRPRTRKGGACGRIRCRSAGHRPGNTGRNPSTGARGGRGRSGISWPSLVICGRGCQSQGYAQMHRPGVPAVCERSEAMRSGAAARVMCWWGSDHCPRMLAQSGGAMEQGSVRWGRAHAHPPTSDAGRQRPGRTDRASVAPQGTRWHQLTLAEAYVGAAATRPAKKRPLRSDGPSGATPRRWGASPSNQRQHLGAMAVGRHGAHPRRHGGHAGWDARRATRAGVPAQAEVLSIQSASSAYPACADSYGFMPSCLRGLAVPRSRGTSGTACARPGLGHRPDSGHCPAPCASLQGLRWPHRRGPGPRPAHGATARWRWF